MRKIFYVLALSLLISGCATTTKPKEMYDSNLQKFAYANCMMWYFDSKGIDTEDIRAISGGIVETSDISIDVFQEIALAVKDYQPNIQTKQVIDVNLAKCFHLDKSEDLLKLFAK